MSTIVVFRVWRDSGDVFALFPQLPADVRGHLVTFYQHVGQHGAADYAHCIRMSRRATPDQYAPLLRELEQIGYAVTIRLKRGK